VLLLDPSNISLSPSELVVPLVPVGEVSLGSVELEPIVTSVSTNCPAPLADSALVADPAVADDEPDPLVPVVPGTASALFRQPVTVTLLSDMLLGDCDMLCAPSPTAMAAANTVPKKN
jgi:hypothetical protein